MIDIGDPGEHGELRIRRALTNDQAGELAINGLAAMLFKLRPDVLLVISGFFIPPQMLDQARWYGTRVIIMHTESPYEDARQIQLAKHADINMINDPLNLDRFREVANTSYAPHAFRPIVHHPARPDPKLICDLGFVGTGFGSRRWFFEHMDLAGRDVLLAGNWQGLAEDSPLRAHLADPDPEHCCDNTETARVYQAARCGINLYRREHDEADTPAGVAMGPREVEMAACGLFFLRDPRMESDRVLPMLPSFSGPEEASELLRWWLAHQTEREYAAEAARAAVSNRTFIQHARHLLRILDRIPVTI
jgi:hypothetical protein